MLKDSKAVAIRCPTCVSKREIEQTIEPLHRLKSIEERMAKLDEVPKTIETAIANATDHQKPPTWAQHIARSTKNTRPQVTMSMVNKAVKSANVGDEIERSVVISGLPDMNCNGPPTTVDQQNVDEICNSILAQPGEAFELQFDMIRIEKSFRQNDNSDQKPPRLLKVLFYSKVNRDLVLQYKHRLAKSEKFNQVFIQPALTPEKSKRLFELRQKCRERNEKIHGQIWREKLDTA